MKTNTPTGSKTKKVVNLMIIGMVAAGAAIFAVINQSSSEMALMPTLFLVFFGAIITVQIIPGVVLLGSILKSIVNLGRKQVPVEVSTRNNAHK
ncbi:MAG: hypothetical protein A2X79_01135 [Desulfuromonadaceae bacterium GWB2_53_15]|nr:MAG: hypothetical protein A2X83_07890 [Desulfuromonadales bacterium GWD2_54_10]OHB30420.1 MAG: hypothetical protein A2X79_01135 [Desulfuromonadaceae bacterium GWB2_53_15]